MKKNNNEYITYLTPEFIYVPFDNINTLELSKNGKVLNNQCLGTNVNNDKIFSPVSGRILGTKTMDYLDKTSNSLVIENDFIDKREKLNYTRNVNKLKKSEIIESLTKYGLNKKINSKTTLVIKSIYNKNYDLKDMVINYESYEEILEAIDEFMDIFNMKNCYICIDKNDLYSIASYEKYINAFPNICIVSSSKKIKESNSVTYLVEEILAIYKAIHLDYLYDNTIITIYNKEPIIVKIKIYTSLCELLKAFKITYKGKKILVNNKLVDNITNFVIDRHVRSIVVKE